MGICDSQNNNKSNNLKNKTSYQNSGNKKFKNQKQGLDTSFISQ
jgi:hypothetical protein